MRPSAICEIFTSLTAMFTCRIRPRLLQNNLNHSSLMENLTNNEDQIKNVNNRTIIDFRRHYDTTWINITEKANAEKSPSDSKNYHFRYANFPNTENGVCINNSRAPFCVCIQTVFRNHQYFVRHITFSLNIYWDYVLSLSNQFS